PFGAKGERDVRSPRLSHPLPQEGVATTSREDGVAGQRTIPSVALRAFASLRPSARKGKRRAQPSAFTPFGAKGERDVRSPRLSHPLPQEGVATTSREDGVAGQRTIPSV